MFVLVPLFMDIREALMSKKLGMTLSKQALPELAHK